jgi:hypothetical protein
LGASDERSSELVVPRGAGGAALVKDRERSAGPQKQRCPRPAKNVRYRLPDGTFKPVRCKAPNKCDYCAKLTAQENAVVVLLDAEMACPTVGITVTTRDPDFGSDRLRKASASLWRSLRKECPQLEYLGFLEFTSGKHARDGRRRAHLHYLVKGLPREDAAAVEAQISMLWKRYTGDSWRCDCQPLRTPVGAMRYLTGHHHKLEQAPPPGFKGKRLRPSLRSDKAGRTGYFELPIRELRAIAKRHLADERLSWAVEQAIEAELYGRGAFEADRQLTGALVAALRDLVRNPAELQMDFTGTVDNSEERAELVRRAVAEAKRLREAHPAQLVRVRERPIVDSATGEIVGSTVVEVLGEVRPAT